MLRTGGAFINLYSAEAAPEPSSLEFSSRTLPGSFNSLPVTRICLSITILPSTSFCKFSSRRCSDSFFLSEIALVAIGILAPAIRSNEARAEECALSVSVESKMFRIHQTIHLQRRAESFVEKILGWLGSNPNPGAQPVHHPHEFTRDLLTSDRPSTTNWGRHRGRNSRRAGANI